MVSGMSNSATNVEIEDVLSSIRRLVSDDSHGQNQAGAAADGNDAQNFGRLVLTPAQRVPDDAPQMETETVQETSAEAEPILLTEAYAPTEEAEPEQDHEQAQEHHHEHHNSEQEHQEAAQDNDDHWEEASDPNIVSDIVQEELQAALAALDLGSDNQNDHDEDHSEDQSEDHAEDHSEEWHEDEAEVEAAEVLFENAAEDDDQQDEAEPEVAVAEPTVDDYEKDTFVEEVQASAAEESVDDERARTLEAKIAELEAMIATNDATWDGDVVDETGNAAYVGDASLPWEDASFSDSPMAAFENASAEEAAAMSMERVAEPASQGTPDVQPEPELQPAAMIDEDMLREMVTQIVRQELQGKLGERITRSVRKLVRQEIHRALMSQEFE